MPHQFRDNAPYQLRSSYGMRTTPLALGNIILLKEKRGMRESIPRQIDKKSRVPKEEKGIWGLEAETGVWNSQGGEKDKLFSPSTFLD